MYTFNRNPDSIFISCHLTYQTNFHFPSRRRNGERENAGVEKRLSSSIVIFVETRISILNRRKKQKGREKRQRKFPIS